MSIKEVSGHRLEIGDKVRMNITVIGAGDLDGVDITSSGENYWRYMNEHPNEVYTVVGLNLETDDASYFLSGYMQGNNWYADELIHVPEPKSVFEVIKNMTIEEMGSELLPMMLALCEEGVPSPEVVREWLSGKPEN